MSKRMQVMAWVAGLVLLALIAWGLSRIHLSGGTSRPREQTVKITLPDTPPPPPPKPEEKRPEPKPENKPQQQQEAKPVQAPPAPAPMKMEGAAGNGPSAFQAGSVTSDYRGGTVNTGPGGGVPNADERRRDMFYVNNVKRQLKDALEHNLDTDAGQMDIEFSLWIGADGRLSRFELHPTGNTQVDADARRAFEAVAKVLRLDKPGAVPQPLRMRMSLLSAG